MACPFRSKEHFLDFQLVHPTDLSLAYLGHMKIHYAHTIHASLDGDQIQWTVE